MVNKPFVKHVVFYPILFFWQPEINEGQQSQEVEQIKKLKWQIKTKIEHTEKLNGNKIKKLSAKMKVEELRGSIGQSVWGKHPKLGVKNVSITNKLLQKCGTCS